MRFGMALSPDGTEHRVRLFLPNTGVPRATLGDDGFWVPVKELTHWRKVSGEWSLVTTDYGLEVAAELQSKQQARSEQLALEPPAVDDVPYDVLVCAVRTLTARVDKFEEMCR